MMSPDVVSDVLVPEADMPTDVNPTDFPPTPELNHEPLGHTEPTGSLFPVIERDCFAGGSTAFARNRPHDITSKSTDLQLLMAANKKFASPVERVMQRAM
jgi:hypothetical protein